MGPFGRSTHAGMQSLNMPGLCLARDAAVRRWVPLGDEARWGRRVDRLGAGAKARTVGRPEGQTTSEDRAAGQDAWSPAPPLVGAPISCSPPGRTVPAASQMLAIAA